MSAIIVGGNERMKRQYEAICKDYGYDAKVFIQTKAVLKRKIGSPDLVILFTSTVSHGMVDSAVTEAKRAGAAIVRSHSSSAYALRELLDARCRAQTARSFV